MESLTGRDFYKNILELVKNSYMPRETGLQQGEALKREGIINRIHSVAKSQITAEGNGALQLLLTEPIENLIRKYRQDVPNTVIMGAKGAGKTFLYREILRNQTWEAFIKSTEKDIIEEAPAEAENQVTVTIPLLASGNAAGFHDIIENAVQKYNQYNTKGKMKPSAYIDNQDKLRASVEKVQGQMDWKKSFRTQ